jgi:hypothetical protein
MLSPNRMHEQEQRHPGHDPAVRLNPEQAAQVAVLEDQRQQP